MLNSISLFLSGLALKVVSSDLANHKIEQLLKQGNAAQAAGDFSNAERIFRLILQHDPQHARAYNNLGNALAKQGMIDEAMTIYRQAIRLNNADAYNNLGTAFYLQNRLDQALVYYLNAIQIDPKHVGAHTNLGIVLHQMGELEETVRIFQRAIQLNPACASVHNCLGAILYAQKKLDQARASFKRAIQLKPNYSLAYVGLGNVLFAQGKLGEAISSYRQALNLPNEKSVSGCSHALARNGLGVAQRRQGNLDAAIEHFQCAIAADPKLVHAQNNLVLSKLKPRFKESISTEKVEAREKECQEWGQEVERRELQVQAYWDRRQTVIKQASKFCL